MIRDQQDFLTGLMFLALGGLAIVHGSAYSVGSASEMGPGYFPVLIGCGLVALALILILRSFRGGKVAIGKIATKPLFFVVVGLSLFALLLEPAGLLIAVFVTVFVGSMAGDEFNVKGSLLVAAVLSVGCVLTFVYALGQQIPVFGTWFGVN